MWAQLSGDAATVYFAQGGKEVTCGYDRPAEAGETLKGRSGQRT
jgi:hypothetical protein